MLEIRKSSFLIAGAGTVCLPDQWHVSHSLSTSPKELDPLLALASNSTILPKRIINYMLLISIPKTAAMVDHGDLNPSRLPTVKDILAAPPPLPDADLELPPITIPHECRPKPLPHITEHARTVVWGAINIPTPCEPIVRDTGPKYNNNRFDSAAGLFPPPVARPPYWISWRQMSQAAVEWEAQIHRSTSSKDHPAATAVASVAPPPALCSPRRSQTMQHTTGERTQQQQQPTRRRQTGPRVGNYSQRVARLERATFALRRQAFDSQVGDCEGGYRQRAAPYERKGMAGGRRRVLPLRDRASNV